MKIETLDDWNGLATGCGCCEMPACPVPTRDSQAIVFPLRVCGASIDIPIHPHDEVPTSHEFRKYQRIVDVRTSAVSIAGGTSGTRVKTTTTQFSRSLTESWGCDGGIATTSDIGTVPFVYYAFWERTYSFTQETTAGGGYRVRLVESYQNSLGSTAVFTWQIDWTAPILDTLAHMVATAKALFEEHGYEGYLYSSNGDGDFSFCDAIQYQDDAPEKEQPVVVDWNISRFKWDIPREWTGGYFKITWDVIEEPEGWDATIDDPEAEMPEELPKGTTEEEWWAEHQIPDPDAPKRSYFKKDQTWTWDGPGTPVPAPVIVENEVTNQAAIDAANNTWKSGWYEIPPPDIEGTRRVVNIRFKCYRSTRIGSKPQIAGDGVSLPDLAPLRDPVNDVDGGNENEQGSPGKTGRSGVPLKKTRETGLRTSDLKLGGLKLTGLRTSGLRIGGQKTTGLKMKGLRTSTLRVNGLRTSKLRTSGLKTSGLKTAGLKTSGLKSSGLKTGGGLKSSGLRSSGLH